MYPEELVQPMRDELTHLGFNELRTEQDVDAFFEDKAGTSLVVINSVCGCAAGTARPGVRLALSHAHKPNRLSTVFAGNDREAVAKVRANIVGYPPSSPSMALFKDGELVYMMERHQIEGRSPEQIAEVLTTAFDLYCQD